MEEPPGRRSFRLNVFLLLQESLMDIRQKAIDAHYALDWAQDCVIT